MVGTSPGALPGPVHSCACPRSKPRRRKLLRIGLWPQRRQWHPVKAAAPGQLTSTASSSSRRVVSASSGWKRTLRNLTAAVRSHCHWAGVIGAPQVRSTGLPAQRTRAWFCMLCSAYDRLEMWRTAESTRALLAWSVQTVYRSGATVDRHASCTRAREAPARGSLQLRHTALSRSQAPRLSPQAASAALRTACHRSGGSSGSAAWANRGDVRLTMLDCMLACAAVPAPASATGIASPLHAADRGPGASALP